MHVIITISNFVSLFSDHTPFIVKDKENEKKYEFKLVTSLQKAADHKLFKDYTIHVTKNVKPDPANMKGEWLGNSSPSVFTLILDRAT